MQHETNNRADWDMESQKQAAKTNSPGSIIAAVLISLGVLCGMVVVVGVYVWVCRTYLGEKQNEIGIPAFVGLLGFIAVSAQIIVNVQQWKAMKDALRHGEQWMTCDQSAYLIVSQGHVLASGGDQKAKVTYSIVNAGRTPAYKVRIYHQVEWKTLDFKFTQKDIKQASGGKLGGTTIVGPGCEMSLAPESDEPIPLSVLAEYEKAGKHLFVWGLITYEDIFQRKRWTTFSYFHLGNDSSLTSAVYGNDAN